MTAALRSSRRVVVTSTVLLGVLTGLGVLAACQSPTQIVLHIRTNVQCEREAPTPVVSVGQIDRPDDEAPLASTHVDCTLGGAVGTLVITPTSSEERDATTGIRVAMRYAKDLDPGRDTGDCTRASAAFCIVQRRIVRFRPHETLDLPIDLDVSCKGVYCSALETCNHASKCVSAECTDGTCEAVASSGGPAPDAGFAADGAPLDGALGSDADAASLDGSGGDGSTNDGSGGDGSAGDGGTFVARCSDCNQNTQSCCGDAAAGTVRCLFKPTTCAPQETMYSCWSRSPCQSGCCGKVTASAEPFTCHAPGTCAVIACSSAADCTFPDTCIFQGGSAAVGYCQ